jgi:hypothetical protein
MNIGNWFIDNIFIYLFVLLIVFIIYLASGTATKRKMGSFIINNIVVIFLVGLVVFGWDRWGTVADHEWLATMRWAVFMPIELFIFYEMGSNFLAVFRNNTTHFVANGVHGSCALHYDIGRWTIWYLGTTGSFTIDSDGVVFPWPFPNKIAITPKVSWDFNGDSPISITQVFKTDLNRIHPRLKRAIVKDSKTIFARGDIYFGIVSEKLRTDNPKWDDLQQDIEQKNAKYNTLEDSFDDVATNTEKYEGHVRRVKIMQKDDGVSRRPVQSGENE